MKIPKIQIQLIRNATIKLKYGNKIFLIDPWLAPKGETGSILSFNNDELHIKDSIKESIRIPICDLPLPVPEILENVDYYIVTHLHRDHFDMDKYNKVLDRNTPIFIQNNDEYNFMKNIGFKSINILKEEGNFIENIKLTKVYALHGSLVPCGEASGLIFENDNLPTIYFTGDTIMCDEVRNIIKKFQPEIIILNSGDAQLIKYGHLTMDENAISDIYDLAPNTKIIVVHLDNVAHAYLSRNTLLQKLTKKSLEHKILIPNDGQIYDF